MVEALRLNPAQALRGGVIWPAVAAMIATDAARRRVCLRDAVVLLPFAAPCESLRVAFAARGGWQPRVETTATLAAALAPVPAPGPGQCSGEPMLDRLQARQLLSAMPDLDPSTRDHAAQLLADAAGTLALASAARAPGTREAWWARVREVTGAPVQGPGALENALLRAALAWAEDGAPQATDVLFELHPAAWYAVRLGGADRLAEALVAHAGGAVVDLDPPSEDPFTPFLGGADLRLVQAEEFEAEAWAAAAEVLQALSRHAGRVALVALDRALVRRIEALLGRAGVVLDDETGWKLSTDPAAGPLLARVRAAMPGAGGDERLDWLKRWRPAVHREAALRALEALWRQGRNAGLAAAQLAQAQALWRDAQAVLAPWTAVRERTLAGWLQLLQRQLVEDGEGTALTRGPAGRELLRMLQLAGASTAWRAALQDHRVDLPGFADWLQAWCESVTVQRPPHPAARVVLTPLARAVGRDFAQVVLAGADARHLAAAPPTVALIGEALAARIGLPTRGERLDRQRLALAQLVRQGALTLLWRRRDADAALGPADDVLWLQDSARTLGLEVPVQEPAVCCDEVEPRPVRRPAPVAAAALPTALSASAVDALRQCPYRFFARSVLRLTIAPQEIERDADKRDWGDWLHLTLQRFHSTRQADQDDPAALLEAAEAARLELQLDAAAMLPFRATLERVLQHYLAWWAPREAAGWRWQCGEQAFESAPTAWAPQTLRGRVDRVDVGPAGQRLVLDYKTTRADVLRQRVAEPLEDTQLAFYAALLQPAAGDAISAAYLALDEATGPQLWEHAGVADSASRLLQHLGHELRRLREGAPLAALGEGPVCDTCDARGLCRRDDWTDGAPVPEPQR